VVTVPAPDPTAGDHDNAYALNAEGYDGGPTAGVVPDGHDLLARADVVAALAGYTADTRVVRDLAAAFRAARAERDALRVAGDVAAAELAKWGHSDFGPSEQHPAVVEAVNGWYEAIAQATRDDQP
jgi:hypothetical protein